MSSIAAIRRFQKLLAVGFSRKSSSQPPLKPIVSFTFDDFPRSALTVAGKILDNYNVCGTYYAAMGLMGKITEVGEMFDSRDLKHLVAAGHELACHTFDHVA